MTTQKRSENKKRDNAIKCRSREGENDLSSHIWKISFSQPNFKSPDI